MPSGPFSHVCMLVHDLDKAIEDWTKILRVLDPQSLEKRIVKYDEFSSGADQGMKWATFVNDGSQTIQDRRQAVRAEHRAAEHPPAAPAAIESCASRNVDSASSPPATRTGA